MAPTSKVTQNPYDRKLLPDHASETDMRQLPIDKVGIEGLSYPVQVLDKNRETQSTVATISLSVGLPAEFKGTHMSRLVEVLNAERGEMTLRNLPNILARVQQKLESEEAFIKVDFPYFISKKAPISGVESLMEYQCSFEGSRKGANFDFVLHVCIPVTTLCPCSKAISAYGAHNQRSSVKVQVRSETFAWIEDVITAVESCASAPLYALLKREDEKYVTEQAYDNPKFVEDLVRDSVVAIRRLAGVSWIRVEASNNESIHNHAAFGCIEWPRTETTRTTEHAFTHSNQSPASVGFGPWLRGLRSSRNYGQQEFATHLDISSSYLSRLESGGRQPTRELAHSIAHLLGLEQQEVEIRAGYAPADLIPLLLASLGSE